MLENERTWESVESNGSNGMLVMEARVDSNHQPITVWIKGNGGGKGRKRKNEEE